MTCSGWPVNFFRSSGSCVATPTGHVLRWHFRIMMQPSAISGAVENPNSSAPSMQAITTSRPVFSWPSVCRRTRLRRSLRTSVWCVSAMPSSQGMPACLMLVSGEAPVPPLSPEIRMLSACPLATPAAIVPTPTSETSLTLIRADGLAFFRSKMSWAEIFDRIDVVVRRRADQAHAGRRVPHGGDDLVDLAAGQFSPFAGLGPLGDFDLQLVGVGEVPARDAEAAGGDLLDRRSLGIAVGEWLEAGVILAPFARVALAAQAIHGDGERFVRLGGNRAEAHGAGAEPLDDFGGRLDLVERNRRSLF